MPLRIGFFVILVGLYLTGVQLAAHHAPLWVVAALMGVVFIALVAAMYLRVLPAVLALPILAVLLAAIAGMHWQNIFTNVVEKGGMRLSTAILAAMLGSILAQVVEKTGIAHTAIKKTAELGGDRPIVLAVILTIVIAILFTTLGGLGAVIMVATIVIPILLSLGLRPLYVGCLFLLAMSLGGSFNLTNWELYKTALGMTNAQIGAFAWPFAGFTLLATFAFLAIEGKRMGRARYKATLTETAAHREFVPWYALLTPIVPLVPVLFFALLPSVCYKAPVATVTFDDSLAMNSVTIQKLVGAPATPGMNVTKYAAFSPVLQAGQTLTLTKGTYEVDAVAPLLPGTQFVLGSTQFTAEPWHAVAITVKPGKGGQVVLDAESTSAVFDFPISVALILGILYGAISTWKRGQSTVQLLTKAAFDGVGAVGPALVIMLGIGMVLIATMSPEVSAVMQPILKAVVPHGNSTGAIIGYVAFFTILAPLALYRGPLNLWGMGSGLIGALNGLMPAGAIMGAFMSVGMIQGVSDPTNTQNVWIANYTNTDVQDILKRTLPYMWILAVIGLLVSAVLYYGGVVK